MTTTDLIIIEIGVGPVVTYSSGLFGQAVDGFDRLKELVASGAASGTWDMCSGEFELTGAELLPLLRLIGDGYRTNKNLRETVGVDDLERMVQPDARYHVSFDDF